MIPETATRADMLESMMSLVLKEVKGIISGRLSKKLLIFGAGSRGIVVYSTLRSLGCGVAYFVDSDAKKQNSMLCGIPVYEPMTIMYENFDDIYVIVAADSPAEIIETLKGLGLDPHLHMECVFDRQSLDNGTFHADPMPLMDVFLGFNRMYDLPGFYYSGNEQSHNTHDGSVLRIITLGGSTTDPGVMDPVEWNDTNKRTESAGSWPRFLHGILELNGIKNSIYNGGLCAYTSAQEVLKLIRDGLTLRPDIVITFDGVNDAHSIYWHENKYPKVHSYFKELQAGIEPLLLRKNIRMPLVDSQTFVEGICYGIESDVSAPEEWYANQRIMRAVCNEFNIEFISFLQPCGVIFDTYLQSCDVLFRVNWFLWNFFNTYGRVINECAYRDRTYVFSTYDLNQLLSEYIECLFTYSSDSSRQFQIKQKKFEDFYAKAKQLASECDYIVDITDVLNGYPDAMHDLCHCTAHGNTLIAQRVYEELKRHDILSRAMARVSNRERRDE